jgi:hypothetical protein
MIYSLESVSGTGPGARGKAFYRQMWSLSPGADSLMGRQALNRYAHL